MSIVTELKYTANLDSGVQMTPLKNSFLSGDQEAHRFIVSCFRSTSRQPVDLTGAGVTGYFIRADQSTVVIDGKVEDNCAVLTLPAACYAKQGRFSLVIKASMSGVIHTILWAESAISQSHTGAIIDPGEVVPTLDELLAQIDAMEQATAAATTATETANAAAAQAVEIATAKGNEALQNVADAVTAQNETIGQLTEDIDQFTADMTTALLTKAPAIECEASGSLVTVTDAAAQPAVSLVTHIEPVQEGEGDPSPNNVRPISGWDSVSAQRTGENLIEKRSGIQQINIPAGTAIYAMHSGSADFYLYGRATDGGQYPIVLMQSNVMCTAVLEQNVVGLGISESAFETLGTDDQIMVSFEPFEGFTPFEGQPLTADLPETVYGGTLDWGTGVLTVDKAVKQINSAYTLYNFPGDGHIGGQVTASDMKSNSRANGMCDKLTPVVSPTNQAKPCITFGANSKTIYFIFPSTLVGTTLESLNAYLAENPLTVVYPLETPYTIQLTPQQLDMLKGTNNVWSSTGDTDLVYVADTKMYIDQKLAAIAAATLNN